MKITDEKRKNTVKQAIADSYIVGKASAKQAAEKIRARYGAL